MHSLKGLFQIGSTTLKLWLKQQQQHSLGFGLINLYHYIAHNAFTFMLDWGIGWDSIIILMGQETRRAQENDYKFISIFDNFFKDQQINSSYAIIHDSIYL